MLKYKPTIGLEIHVELKTRTKMFCDSLNDPNERHPNINICPVCTGQPGALPTINSQAVEGVLKVGMALKGEIPQYSKFDRKNYFYPDLPKGYQISQYDLPLIFGGVLNGVYLRRIHLEEDTGRLLHAENGSLVDFNRAGIPLMELVTEPDIVSAEQAVEFAKELQLILRYLNVSDADMERGQMRIEANISLQSNPGELGTKVEIKNINSFRAIHDAIEYEMKRQVVALEDGKKVVHETRGWDENKKITIHQRLKEESHDYRYFSEPDLPPLDLSKFDLGRIKVEIPELPREKRVRFEQEYHLTSEQIEILVSDRNMARYFEEVVSELAADDDDNLEEKIKIFFNYFMTDLRGLMLEKGVLLEDLKIAPENFADLVELIVNKEISSRTAKNLLSKMFGTGIDPRQVLQAEGLEQVSDGEELRKIARRIADGNQSAVNDYKGGKENALQFLIGKAMSELKGRGNPGLLREIFKEVLK